jgi:hypothetical protein
LRCDEIQEHPLVQLDDRGTLEGGRQPCLQEDCNVRWAEEGVSELVNVLIVRVVPAKVGVNVGVREIVGSATSTVELVLQFIVIHTTFSILTS